jgi:glycosyltransferase involved in cell wall biosynthesis
MVALWLTRWGERRVVASVHCYGRQRWFYRFASRQLGSRMFWLSPAMKRYYGAGTDDSWTQCIPGCVPAPTGPDDSRHRIRNTRVRFGGIGMLVPWKGWHLIVAAIAALPADVRERVRFDHIGGAGRISDAERYAAELRHSTTRLGLDNVITWRGEEASSAPLLSEINCLIVASHQEPFSIAVLEALSSGVPVLAADSGGAQDLIVEERSGWFFRSGDAASLAAKLEMLATTDTLDRAEVGVTLLRPFTAPLVAQQWLAVYAGLT